MQNFEKIKINMQNISLPQIMTLRFGKFADSRLKSALASLLRRFLLSDS